MLRTYILGGYQTDFAWNWSRAGGDLSTIMRDTTLGTLDACSLAPADIQTIHVGNAFGELHRGQAHLGAMVASVLPDFSGTPASRHEAACASASMAVLAAMAEIEAGRYQCALVLGAEEERNVPGVEAAQIQGAAAWVGKEGVGVRYMWPHMFNLLGREYERRFGLRYEHLGEIARINVENAKRNPNAQTRDWNFNASSFGADDEANPVIEGIIRRQDCCQITDGGAALVLASPEYAQRWLARHGGKLEDLPYIAGWGHRTASLLLGDKLALSREQPYVLPQLRAAVTDTWKRAGIAGPEGLDGIEVHDCFTTTEYMAIDHLGLTAPGESWKAIEEGRITMRGDTPINPSGGLIGGGHPVGATGVRMLLDAARQVTGAAGDYQVEGARTFQTLNIGGSCATVASFVVRRDEKQ
ncbi:MAG: thiolase domain-containing protein [Betaproteobacteria bacterium]|nr:thiolase domain-containing protein [Betaproteobacteria bacterium]